VQIEHCDPQNVEETVIRIEGLARPVTLAHISDSHVCEVDERDPGAIARITDIGEKFRNYSPARESMRTVLRQVLQGCLAAKPDCLLLTGDMVHFPTWANVEALEADLAAAGVPYLYTPGNHDWEYPGKPWTDVVRREHYSRFGRLADDTVDRQVCEVGGVQLIAIDNSMYQATSAQVAFLKEQMRTGKPCLLCMHIPLYVPSLLPDVMQRWKAPIMMACPEGWTDRTRALWGVPGIEPATQAFYDLVTDAQAPNLAGLFCGHIHIPHADAFAPGRYQYSPRPGYLGGYRIIRLVPV
jgi:hypothetical protein